MVKLNINGVLRKVNYIFIFIRTCNIKYGNGEVELHLHAVCAELNMLLPRHFGHVYLCES